jgi:hypothetical protein
MKKTMFLITILTGLLVACGERSGDPAVNFEAAPSEELQAGAYAPNGVDGQGWSTPTEGDGMSVERASDLGRTCQVPDGCDSDSPEYPGCINANCEIDCALPVFGGLSAAGYCTRPCRYDWECSGAVEDGSYGSEFVCLSDGVSGVCAPGTNARCDGDENGMCAREGESCKMQLIFAPDKTYGAVCQPSTPEGVGVGERCDEESGVSCANDLCMFDGDNGFGTCMSICDPNAETSICPTGFRCFDEYYPFGTDFDNPIDMCLPEYCEKDANCPDDFYCGLTYEFNSERILRGFCLPKQEGAASDGDPCDEDTNCEGATCFDSDTDNGYCSGLCDDSSDCKEGFSCNIVNFGIDASPGSAPAQLCMRGTGSRSDCRSNADCENGEVCDYMSDGELDGGRPITEITLSGRCVAPMPNSVSPGEECNGDTPCAVDSFCLRAGVTFCGGACASTQDCKDAYGLDDYVCYGYGLSDTVVGGLCVPAEAVDVLGSLTSCRNNNDCEIAGGDVCTANEDCGSNVCTIAEGDTEGTCEAGATEFCGFNVIGTLSPQAETICKSDNGLDAGGAPCAGNDTCQSGFCSMGEDGMGMCSNVCRQTIDCAGGMICADTVVETEYNSEVSLCVISMSAPVPGDTPDEGN